MPYCLSIAFKTFMFFNLLMMIFKSELLYLFISIFFIASGYAQEPGFSKKEWIAKHASEIKSIISETIDFSDLEPLRDILKDTRIVLLGEQSHGESSAFSAKVRLVKFLHAELGFEVLALESGMYDCAKIAHQMKSGSSLIKEKENSIFYMYSNSKEVKHLFNYIDAHADTKNPLLFTGMDSQHTGQKSQDFMIDDLAAFLNLHHSKLQLKENWKLFKKLTLEIFKMKREVRKEDKLSFYTTLKDIRKELTILPSEKTELFRNPQFWLQIIASIESQAKRYWGDVQDMDRDRQMAVNMSWLVNNSFRGKKIIIWAHNFHIAKKVGDIKPMGYFLKNEFKERMYTMGFTGYNGNYLDFISGKTIEVKKPSKQSFEYMINTTGIENCIIDFKQLPEDHWLQREQKGRLANFGSFTGVLPNVFDGMFYIKTTTPSEQNK